MGGREKEGWGHNRWGLCFWPQIWNEVVEGRQGGREMDERVVRQMRDEAKTAWFEDPNSASSRPHTHLNKPSMVPGISIGPCGIIAANGTKTQGLNVFKEFNMKTDHVISLLIYCQFYCGPELDDYHITLLKTLLDGHSLEWFIDNIETEDEDMEVDFTTMVCTLHHRFITVAMAQQASWYFDAICYNIDEEQFKRSNMPASTEDGDNSGDPEMGQIDSNDPDSAESSNKSLAESEDEPAESEEEM
ncbi:hypothetical protein C8J57DRAFT_1251325 [Mycena rebaudengoi]|nr:hypothetical protein C8J57DRAFT_1251325 [Mycena rebaudengoi]